MQDKLGDSTGRAVRALPPDARASGDEESTGTGSLPAGRLAGHGERRRQERLAQAVRSDDHAAIKRLLAAHANPNAPLPDKSTVLAWAVDRQDADSVQHAAGGRRQAQLQPMSIGASPLTLACELGDPGIVSRPAEGRRRCQGGASRRHHGAGRCAPAPPRPTRWTLLVAKGANVNAADPQWPDALMWAAAKGRTDNIKFLVDAWRQCQCRGRRKASRRCSSP